MTKKTDLMVLESVNLPALDSELVSMFQDEMDGLTVDFDRVKIPSGGGLAFEVPGDDPDEPDMVKEIVGVIVDQHPLNAYWEEKYTGQNNPPDCASMDGKIGVSPNGETRECATCVFNQWGSASEGGGKACKNMRRIYILPEGEMFPLLLTLPPTSLKNFANYLAKRVVGKGRRSHEVITKVTLKKATSGSGIAYSQASFALVGVLNESDAARVAEYAKSIKATTRRVEVAADDYSVGSKDELPFD